MRLLHPVPGARITQRFRDNPGAYAAYGLPHHMGIDFSCVVDTPVRAAYDGVTANGDEGTAGFGRYVRIDTAEGWRVYTGHLSRYASVVGRRVKAGDIIGYSGNTGNSTGPHVHFEVRTSADRLSAIDPEPYIVEEESMFVNGWHAGNDFAMTTTDWAILETAKPGMFVWLPGQAIGKDQLKRIVEINPEREMFMRPYFKPRVPTDEVVRQYIDQCKRAIDDALQYVRADKLHVCIFNEPNMPSSAGWEGFGPEPEMMMRFDGVFCQTYSALKAYNQAPKIPWSPLTIGNRDAWFAGDPYGHYYMHGPEACKTDPSAAEIAAAKTSCLCRNSLALADEYLAHVYVHHARDAYMQPHYGLRHERYAKFFPKPMKVWITECGMPNRNLWPEWGGPAMIAWLNTLSVRGGVDGIAWWILGNNPKWGAPWYSGSQPRAEVYQIADWFRANQGATAPTPQPEAQPMHEDAVRAIAWNALGVPYNKDAAFVKYAKANNLGRPLGPERREGRYTVQPFDGGIVYAVDANWDAVSHYSW